MMHFKSLLIVPLLSILLAPEPSQAVTFDTTGLQQISSGSGGQTVSFVYDAAVDVFMMEENFTATNPYFLQESRVNGIEVGDIEGRFVLSANIADFGVFSGGSFSLVGTSTTLGIVTDQVLLSGSLDLFFDDTNGPTNGLQFVSNSFSVSSLLPGVFLQPDILLIRQIAMGNNGDNFTASYGPGTPASFGPDIIGYQSSLLRVAEPSSAALLAFGLFGFGWLAKRRRAPAA